MGAQKADTQAILQAADAFEQLYLRAEKAIEEMNMQWRKEVYGTWNGQAAQQAQEAYARFRDSYFERYLQMIGNYQLFLRETAAGGYAQTERSNVELSDLIAWDVGMCPGQEEKGLTNKARAIVDQWWMKLK